MTAALRVCLQAIARDVGPRQLTVRQMLHSAALRSRQPTINQATADQLVRLSLSDLGDTVAGSSPRAGGLRDEEQGLQSFSSSTRRHAAEDGEGGAAAAAGDGAQAGQLQADAGKDSMRIPHQGGVAADGGGGCSSSPCQGRPG